MKQLLAVSIALALGLCPLTQNAAQAADYKAEYRL